MGFRSTFVTEQYQIDWPEWFRAKYKDIAYGPYVLASLREGKTYQGWADLASDIQKVVDWGKLGEHGFTLVFLHECGGITRCRIFGDRIELSEPIAWRHVERSSHYDWCLNRQCDEYRDSE